MKEGKRSIPSNYNKCVEGFNEHIEYYERLDCIILSSVMLMLKWLYLKFFGLELVRITAFGLNMIE